MPRSPLDATAGHSVMRLCAAIVDRLTFAGNIIETGIDSYRGLLDHAVIVRQGTARPNPSSR